MPWLDLIVSPRLPVSGGAVSTIINDAGTDRVHDVDLFSVGMSEAELEAEILRVGRTLVEAWGCSELTVYRTETCITFRCSGFNAYGGAPSFPLVQIILRRYETVSEVIHGFDLGSCWSHTTGSKSTSRRSPSSPSSTE